MRRIVATAAVVGLVAMTLGGGVAHAAGPQPEPPTSCTITGTATFKRALQPNPGSGAFKDHADAMVLTATLQHCTQSPLPVPFVPIDHGVLTLTANARTMLSAGFFAQSCAQFKLTWLTAAGQRIGITRPGPNPQGPCPNPHMHPEPMPMSPEPLPGSGHLTLVGTGTARTSSLFPRQLFTLTLVTSLLDPGYSAPNAPPISSLSVGKFGGAESTIDIGG